MTRKAIRPLLLMGSLPMLLAATPVQESDWVCSISSFMECSIGGSCSTEAEAPSEAPAFFTIDLSAGVVRATEPRFSDRSSPILNTERAEGRLILTGSQQGRGWSVTLTEETGEVSLAISDPDAAVLVFGRCLTTDELGS
jgi:hypothetical protein